MPLGGCNQRFFDQRLMPQQHSTGYIRTIGQRHFDRPTVLIHPRPLFLPQPAAHFCHLKMHPRTGQSQERIKE